MMTSRTVEQILREAEELLQTAKFGLEDIRARPERRRTGLRNAVVFGRNTTWALQNLRGAVPDFDSWYATKQEEMRSDPLMRYFRDLRTKIEKQANTPTAFRGQIKSFSTDDVRRRFYPPPPGALGFFMGDNTGGSGWEIQKPDGSKEKYYIDLPDDIGKFEMVLQDSPKENTSADDLVAEYLGKIEAIVKEARRLFGP